MTKTYAATQYRIAKYEISTSFNGRFIKSIGRKPIFFRPIITAHPYYVRGADLELFSKRDIVQVHLTKDSSRDQRRFETALAFFSSYVRNQMFSLARVSETSYILPEPVDVRIGGEVFAYTPYSTDQCWRETLSLDGRIIARTTGKLS